MDRFQAAYWRRRLFKNSFTRDGQSTSLKGWCVKIQHQGRRRTFSLIASNREAAAREAWQVYRTIISSGGVDVTQYPPGMDAQSNLILPPPALEPLAPRDAGYWKPRLLYRKYSELLPPKGAKEFSVRIDHAGTRHFFLLGTNDEAEAAAKAVEIHQTVIRQGWAAANARFNRELTVAFRWADNPVAWTYTTLGTRPSRVPLPAAIHPPSRRPEVNVAIIEPDQGIRCALAACTNSQQGFRCEATFATATEALRKIPRHRLHLILANHVLPEQSGAACLEWAQNTFPQVTGLLYSVYEDSDELFSAVPGGAVGYLLKRTPPSRLFEPLAESVGPLTREHLAARIREYFQNLLPALPVGPCSLELAKLTAREHEILTLLSRGGVAKEIATSLGISLWTVQGHVKNIFEKLNVHTRTEAVVKFLQK